MKNIITVSATEGGVGESDSPTTVLHPLLKNSMSNIREKPRSPQPKDSCKSRRRVDASTFCLKCHL